MTTDAIGIDRQMERLESALTLGVDRLDVRLSAIIVRLDILNGRVGRVENWQHEREVAIARQAGYSEGQTTLRTRDYAVLAGLLTAVVAVAEIAARVVFT